MNIFPEDIDRKSTIEIKKHQEEKLAELLQYVSINSKFYQDLFSKHKININDIKSIDDLKKVPFTTKDDIYERNQDFICVEQKKIVDYITTSGTMGDPVTFAMTDSDLERLAYNEYISFKCSDGNEDDIYQLMVTLDRRFMAGLAYFLGIKKLGAGMVRVGNGMIELQWDTIKRIKPNALVAVPSFILKLIEYAEANGIDYKNSSIKKAICIGESLRNPDFSLNTLGQRIKDKWDIKLYSTYASTEMGAAFADCSFENGGHHRPELLIVEFIDEHNNPVAEGEAGELVITTLGVEGMPLVRFKTGDVVQHFNGKCKCGRNSLRLGPVIGRKNEMIKYKGTTLYPPALYDILNDMEFVENYIIEVSTNQIGTDDILIRIATNGYNRPADFEKIIKDHFRAKLRVAPTISFETSEQINKIKYQEIKRKPVVFIDRRNNY
ncbi:MAG: phenylacetate--CoA ligase [Bacteroidetes bacterium GWF2_33_16]|nr:MAG: phenylacetate--CoA ligase [Bacteroidetes bacterium GWE2_32_14]OFY03780.1 MAG: phenylacetate--CoA ligase [Bacteroidetes bacterium GWF2_33_16]